MTPILLSPSSTRLSRLTLARSRSRTVRSSTSGVAAARVGRDHHVLGRVALEAARLAADAARPASTSDLPCEMRVVVRSSTGVSYSSLIAKASSRKSLHSWLSEGSSIGHLGEARVVAVVLLVLRAECMPGSSARDDHQAAVHAGVGDGHERVGGDVQADVLHGAQRARPGQGRAERHLQRDLLVGRPLGGDALGQATSASRISVEGVPG